MKIGLFFGSFNPIHVGHLMIANHLAEHTNLDEVWLVVSPQNPFKKKANLLSEYDRLHLVNLAIEGNDKLRSSDIEFSLPKPSYTIDTLVHLKDKYPKHDFSLIMGGDNLPTLHKWKNGDLLQKDFPIYVYERAGYELDKSKYAANIHFVDAPQMYVSSSFIRKSLKSGASGRYLLSDAVRNYIQESGWYK